MVKKLTISLLSAVTISAVLCVASIAPLSVAQAQSPTYQRTAAASHKCARGTTWMKWHGKWACVRTNPNGVNTNPNRALVHQRTAAASKSTPKPCKKVWFKYHNKWYHSCPGGIGGGN